MHCIYFYVSGFLLKWILSDPCFQRRAFVEEKDERPRRATLKRVTGCQRGLDPLHSLLQCAHHRTGRGDSTNTQAGLWMHHVLARWWWDCLSWQHTCKYRYVVEADLVASGVFLAGLVGFFPALFGTTFCSVLPSSWLTTSLSWSKYLTGSEGFLAQAAGNNSFLWDQATAGNFNFSFPHLLCPLATSLVQRYNTCHIRKRIFRASLRGQAASPRDWDCDQNSCKYRARATSMLLGNCHFERGRFQRWL